MVSKPDNTLVYAPETFAAAVTVAQEVVNDPQSPDKDPSVYRLGSGGRVRSVTLINKPETSSISYPVERHVRRKPRAFHPTGPTLASTTGIRFGEAGVDTQDGWGGHATPISLKDFAVPAASAILIRGM